VTHTDERGLLLLLLLRIRRRCRRRGTGSTRACVVYLPSVCMSAASTAFVRDPDSRGAVRGAREYRHEFAARHDSARFRVPRAHKDAVWVWFPCDVGLTISTRSQSGRRDFRVTCALWTRFQSGRNDFDAVPERTARRGRGFRADGAISV
jgi:hypothetical protein